MFEFSLIYDVLKDAKKPVSYAYLCQELREESNTSLSAGEKENLRVELRALHGRGIIDWNEESNEYSLPIKETKTNDKADPPKSRLDGYTDANLAQKIVGLRWSTAEQIAKHIDLEERYIPALEERLHNIVDHRRCMLERKYSRDKKKYYFKFY